ncbi:MAG: hypothetical protein HY692_09360 [Cyanobacteria bacterium NC_groundwater_1444_Ag_S-0.65um_54_12]|nr:hypothetical protein [Cyanobacteria bacterium NC_groundwater_1444_Ag_S-0.65um_54_12]
MTDFANFNFDPFQTDYSFNYQLPDTATEETGLPQLGIMLIDMNVLSLERLEEAISLQREQNVPLVQVFLEGGFCTQDQVIMALRSRPQYG